MIKRATLMVLVVVCLGIGLSAEIRFKNLDGVNVEITFLFKDKSAEMGAIGSFNNWTVPGQPMEKNADGVWETTIRALSTDEIQYKFYSQGSWIPDPLAPDQHDDGYGGKNGLIVVADLLSGATPVVPVLATPGVKLTGEAAKTAYGSKLKFGMTGIVGSKSNFATTELLNKANKGLETNDTGLYGKMNWLFEGTLVPGMSVYFNGTSFDKYVAVWAQDPRGIVSPDLATGIPALLGPLLTNPVNFLGGANPVMNQLKTGIQTPLVNIETGYGGAAPIKHSAIGWDTLGSNNAGDGYMRFDLGPELTKWGPLTVEATVMPQKFKENFALDTWVTLGWDSNKFDIQYDVKSAQKTNLYQFFDKLDHQDVIVGWKSTWGSLDYWVQGVADLYGTEAFDPFTNTAAEISLKWRSPNDLLNLSGSYRFTGKSASMLVGNNNDGTGNGGTQRLLLNLFSKPSDLFKWSLDTSATLKTDKLSSLGVELYAKPYAELKLDGFFGKPSSASAYVKGNYDLATDGSADYTKKGTPGPFMVGEAGAKWYLSTPWKGVLSGMDVFLGWNNWEQYKVLNTLMTSLKLAKGGELNLGAGMRLARDNATAKMKHDLNMWGFALGGSYQLPIPSLKSPLLYGAFTYNIDPIGDGSLSMSDYITANGVSNGDGSASLRLMLKWEF